MLRQAFAHCAIFPTAASRRSLGRVSVSVWPPALSGRLPVVALVGHHPANKLIGREPIPSRKHFPPPAMQQEVISGINPGFPELSQSQGQVAHVLLTRSPLEYPRRGLSARLACVKHAASVRPEPGSNSPSNDQHQGSRNHPGNQKPNHENPWLSPSPGPPRRKNRHDGGMYISNALAFNTLLSSQETRAHQQQKQTRRRGNP